jgi:hypothetical protein
MGGRGAAAAPNGQPGGGNARRGSETVDVLPAEPAPSPRLFAYVWPAIALGPVEALLVTLRGEGPDELAISSLSGIAGSVGERAELLAAEATRAAAAAGAGGVAGISANSGISTAPEARYEEVSRDLRAFLVAVALGVAAMALLAFTVRRELGSMQRWPR